VPSGTEGRNNFWEFRGQKNCSTSFWDAGGRAAGVTGIVTGRKKKSSHQRERGGGVVGVLWSRVENLQKTLSREVKSCQSAPIRRGEKTVLSRRGRAWRGGLRLSRVQNLLLGSKGGAEKELTNGIGKGSVEAHVDEGENKRGKCKLRGTSIIMLLRLTGKKTNSTAWRRKKGVMGQAARRSISVQKKRGAKRTFSRSSGGGEKPRR